MQTKWDLTKLYKSQKDPKIQKDIDKSKKAVEQFESKWKNRQDWLKDPKILKQTLDEYEKLSGEIGICGVVGYYYSLKNALNSDDTEVKAKINQLHQIEVELVNKLEFYDLKLSKINKANKKKFLEDPLLKEYKHYLERLFEVSKYLLSEKEEILLNIKGKTSHSNWVSMTSRLLQKQERKVLNEEGNKEVKNFSEIISLMNNKNQKVRDSAARAFHDINAKYAEIAENEMNSILENKFNDDKLRSLEYPERSRLLSDDIDKEVVEAMLEAVSSRNSLAHKYYKLKAKLLGKKYLKYHERNVPIGDSGKKYSYNRASEIVSTVMTNLDQDFGDIFNKFTNQGHIDVYPQKGKTSGAFCACDLKTSPVYILLNFTGQIDDITTLAHEAGHGINDELMKSQNALNFGSPLSTAEVASTFFQDFALDEIMKRSDSKTRKLLLMDRLNDDVSSIFRQVAAYKFEQELHSQFREKGYLSKDEIGKIFQKHMVAYMGEYVRQDEGSENWWVYWGHFRRFFYVYSYASGLLISKALHGMVREDPKNIKKVKYFLSAGTSKSPKDILLDVGVDIGKREFWNKGLDEIELIVTSD